MENIPYKEQDDDYLEMIRKFISNIKYGTVSIIIQDGKIVQIEKNEKYRIKS